MIITHFLFLLVSTSAEAWGPFGNAFGIVDRVTDQLSPVLGGNPLGIVDRVTDQFSPVQGGRSGLIFLHGLGPSMNNMCKIMSGPTLGLSSSRNKISCPQAPIQYNHMTNQKIPIPFGVSTLLGIRSWFNFWAMPEDSVVSQYPTESKDDLEVAFTWVEEEIYKMIQEGIPSENIVLAGASQGGALTIYTALHTQYKLGGFIPIVTWVPLLKSEPPASLPTPINKFTPILHLNGVQDLIVKRSAGSASYYAMNPVFPNYQLKEVAGTHVTTMGPQNMVTVYCWLKNNVPNMAFSRISPLQFSNILC